jgi:aryl-alcohol dehydrogenase-like predicted oxidoreductase
MESRLLGLDLKVSVVGLGCMGLTHAYGPATEKSEAIRLIREAFEAGCTFFDTAECYLGAYPGGAPANNEEVVGEALRPIRSEVVIATKFGVAIQGSAILTDSRPESIRKAAEGSLKRLGVEVIDLYYQHRVDPKVEPEEVAGVMADLIGEGKIAHWGISEVDGDYLRRADAVCKVTAAQNRYSMMARWHESLFAAAEELKVGFVAHSPLANGLLSGAYGQESVFAEGDYRNFMPQYSSDGLEANQELLALVKEMAKAKRAAPSQLSLAWMISKKPYIVPIPGSSKLSHLRENMGAAKIKLTEAEVRILDEALSSMPMSEVFGGFRTK